jgi:hypothetical protein
MAHVRLMNDQGYEAEIASYTYSDEYLQVFGVDQVPHNRSTQTVSGARAINFHVPQLLTLAMQGLMAPLRDQNY